MLNLIKSKTKKLICCFVLCLGVLVSAFAGYNISKPNEVMAKSTNKIVEDVTASVFGSGYNFNTTTSDEPVSPNGWTKLESEASNNHNDIIKGVVNVENETSFDTDECGTSKPDMPIADKDTTNDEGYYKNLMINATKESGPARFGYRTSSAITLEEDSFYRISVLLYTQQTDEVIEKDDDDNDIVVQEETDPRASIYLTGLVDEDDELYSQTKYEYFSTLGAWEEYFFYIDTEEAKTVHLQLWLGSKTSPVQGAVFFNNVSIIRYSEDAYVEQVSNLTDNNNDSHNIISLRHTTTTPFENNDFEDVTLGGWTRLVQSTSNPAHQLYKSVDVNSYTKVNDDLTITAPGTNCSADNTLALFMYNKVDGYQALESSPITINKQTYYRLTFWAKSDCGQTAATVKLVDKTEENPVESASLSTASTVTANSNKFRNDWTKYTFYIYGPATGAKEVTAQIWLGTQDSKASGYVFVDDFRIEVVDFETYNTNSTNSNTTTLNLNADSDKSNTTNGSFDKIETGNSENIYPSNPKDWTRNGNVSSTTFSGVINTTEEEFNKIEFPNNQVPTCPKALPNTNTTDNNVLMIGSVNETNKQTYASNQLSIGADSCYAYSFYVMTDYARNLENQNYGARVRIASSDLTVFDYFNIYYTDSNWHRVEIRVKNGSSEAANLSIELIFENTIGYVFFDNVEARTLSQTSYDNTSLLDKDTEYYYVDLSKENFENHSFNKYNTSVNGTEVPNNWKTATNNTNTSYVNSGIISADNSLIAGINPSLSGNENYLYISSLSDTYFGYTSATSYTFESEKYYKISINVLTRYLNQEDKKDDINYGASIKLADSSEIMLCGIDTEGVWRTYTIYASFTTSLTSKITLALGYVDEATAGEVLFDNLTIETITQDKFIEEFDVADPNRIATFIDYTEPKEEEETEDDEPWKNEFDWFLIPSLLTALAIIIAVVGYYVRKIKFNRKPRVKTNYDRRKTLDKDIDRREKIALRQQIIAELNAEISSIDKEIEEFNALANQQLEEVRAQIKAEQEELEKVKLDIEIKKKEATANREKQLKETPDFVADKRAEKEYNNFISKLDRQELSVQKKIVAKELKISTVEASHNAKRERFLARQEYIRAQIAKIEAEIEEIAKQEAEIWAEYKAAKADAKRRKAEYKAQVKSDKEKAKKQKAANKTPSTKTTTKKEETPAKTTTKAKATKTAEKKTEKKVEDKKTK